MAIKNPSHAVVAFLRFSTLLARISDTVAASILAAIISINCLSIVARYVLNSPIGWGEEFMRYGIIWAVYIVAGTTFRYSEQMVIDLIDLVPSVIVRRLAAFVSLVATLFLAAIVVSFGFMFILDTGQVSPSMRIPMWIPYSAVVVGYLLIAIQAVAAFLESMMKPSGQMGESL
jgi:C4-dicarboxylate transporter, DctQ subunit